MLVGYIFSMNIGRQKLQLDKYLTLCCIVLQLPSVSCLAGGETTEDEAMIDELNVWRREMQQRMRQDNEFIAELSARKHNPQATDADPEQYVLYLC